METATGRISALRGLDATVEVDSPVACQRCAEGRGCGAGIFQAAEQSREISVRIPADMKVREGDIVDLKIGPRFLLRAAALAYGLPLVTMVLLPGLAWLIMGTTPDSVGISLAIAGLAAGLFAGRYILRRESICEQFIPAIGRNPGVGTS